MITCPAGCKVYRAPSVEYMALHLALAHRWPNHETTAWLVSFVADAMDSMPS